MKETARLMMLLIRSAACGNVEKPPQLNISAEQRQRLLKLSLHHDMAHLVAFALDGWGELGEDATAELFRRQQMLAVYRSIALEQETARTCEALKAAEIDYIPLKGSVLRDWYPEPWMRTSCDADILVRRECLERAVAVLRDTLGYTRGEWTAHDVSLRSENGVHIELHFDTVEDGRVANAGRVLADVWQDACPLEGAAHRYRLSDPMYYLYHVAHMAKHLIRGGCGIKPFLDLWILRYRVEHDRAARENLLRESGLLAFESAALQLAEVWFSGAEADDFSAQLAEFVLRAGVYGDQQSLIAISQVKKGGKWRHLLYKIWLPYKELAVHYPSLRGKKWLLPFYEVRRWCKLVFCGGFRRSLREIQTTATTSGETGQQMAQMLSRLEL